MRNLLCAVASGGRVRVLVRRLDGYFTHQNGSWYMAPKIAGPYELITTAQVPDAFRKVRERYWVSYPSGWTYQLPR